MTRKLTFDHMKPAMKTFIEKRTRLHDELDRMANTGCVTDSDFAAWERQMKENEDALREAYYLDTKDRNSRESVFMVNAESLIALTLKIRYSHD